MGVVASAEVLDALAWVCGPGDAGPTQAAQQSWWSVRPPGALPPRLRDRVPRARSPERL